jgi:hypothetical protein
MESMLMLKSRLFYYRAALSQKINTPRRNASAEYSHQMAVKATEVTNESLKMHPV